MTQVPFYNFQALHDEKFLHEVKERFDEILRENSFIDGKYNVAFEQEFAYLLGTKHCLLLANGTDAIELALEALNIGAGKKVGIPGISFHATAEAVLNRGATPVLIDVDPSTGLMSPLSLKQTLKSIYLDAIIPVHIYGLPAPVAELEEICLPRHIKIIEDAAQAHGTLLEDGRIVGSTQNITTFSFYPTKNLGAFGDAGALTTQNTEMADKIRSLRNHGRGPQGLQIFGRNSRCDHLQAAVIHLKLQHFSDHQKKRKDVAKCYYEELQLPGLQTLDAKFIPLSSWHLFPIFLSNKACKLALREHLTKFGISSSLFYEKALGEEIPLLQFPGDQKDAISFAEKVLCLPIHPFITQKEVQYIAQKIQEFLSL